MLRLCLELGGGNAQFVIGVYLEQSLSILIHFTHTKLTSAGKPQAVIRTHSGIEVSQENELLLVGNTPDYGCEILMKLILCIWSRGQCWSIHAEKGYRAFGSVEAENQETL